MLIPKKQRFDWYKAIQTAQYHTARMKDPLMFAGVPKFEADKVSDYLEPLIKDLIEVKQSLDSGPVPIV